MLYELMDFSTVRLPYYIIFNTAILAFLLVLFFSWKNRAGRGVKAFILSATLELTWFIGYMLELSSNTLDRKLFWDNFQYMGALFAPIALIIFSLQFTKRKFSLKKWLAVLLPVSAILQTIIFLDLWPELIHIDPRIATGAPWDELVYGYGLFANIGNYYAQVLALLYIGILIAGFFKKDIQRNQLAVIALGTAIPTLGVIFGQIFGWRFANQRDISPLMFAISNLVITWGIFRMRLFNVAPIARETLFEKMNNIIIILNQDDRIIDINPAARRVLGGASKDELLGTHISLLQPELYQEFGKKIEVHTEITDLEGHTFSFNVSPIYDKRGRHIGRLVNANDISDQKQIEESLQKINFENELRTRRLNAITDVSQAISQIRDLETLLPLITRQISEKFDFYHVGVFLFSKDGKFAELIATNSDGGKRMLERGHRLEIGQVGVVGRVAQDGNPRVALDVGQDAVYFDNPDLPETHSEMALPLKVGSEIIGILDVQSKRKNVFSEEDTEVFIALANQVAIAIENARQAEATQVALEEARALAKEYVRDSWQKLVDSQESQLAYRFANDSVFAYKPEESNTKDADEEMQIVEYPVRIREETIGVIKIRMPAKDVQKITENDKALITSVGERAGLALESARFLDETQRKAQREAIISDISAKISASVRMDAIIETTVRELGNALDVSEIAFQLVEQDGDEKNA